MVSRPPEASSVVSSFETYSLELSTYLQHFHNFYLIPSVAVAVATGSGPHRKDLDLRFGSPFTVAGGASLYYLF